MKKYAALLMALALMTSGCALALEYPTHEIEDLFEMPDLSIETGSLEYETHEIEGPAPSLRTRSIRSWVATRPTRSRTWT